MQHAAKRKSSLTASLTVLRFMLLLVVACCGLETRVWSFAATPPTASDEIAFATPSFIGENYAAPAYDASDSLVAAKTAPEATGFLGSKGFELKNLQAVRNTPEVIGGRNFSAHALDQMQNRGIMPSVVENTLKQGTSFPGNTAGTAGFYDAVNNVRVIVNSQNGTVITVIRGAP